MTGDDDGDGNGDDQKQEIPPRHLKDHFMFCSCLLNAEKLPESPGFPVFRRFDFVSQINWQPIGKLLNIINMVYNTDNYVPVCWYICLVGLELV